jgi:NDP-sugar pyrophosphorylase family protein
VARLRISGVSEISVLREDMTDTSPESGLEFITCGRESDDVLSRYLAYGLQTLLVVRLGPYVELDVNDFLRFHRETSSPVTQVFDRHGSLDLLAIEAAHLRDRMSTVRRSFKSRARYLFGGWVNRLRDIRDFRQLAKDALLGRVGIRPMGREIAANVWVNEDAWVEESAQIIGPAYIGKNSRVRANCTISGASSIEQECEVDCGTIVDDCCILPRTYLGMALKVHNAVASEHTLFHLGRNVQLHLHDRRLMGVFPERGLLGQARAFLSASLDPNGQPTNSFWHL